MGDRVKIGVAATAGYFLGRTKKAKAALGLALWLTGRGRPRDMLRNQVVKLAASERGQQLMEQVRGPMLAAGRQATVSMMESQAGRMADLLERRAGKLEESVAGAANTATNRLPDGKRRKRKEETAGEQEEESEPDGRAQSGEDEQETGPSSRREPARAGRTRPRVQRETTREPPIERRAPRRTAER